MQALEAAAKALLRDFPHAAILYNFHGIALAGLNRFDEAVQSYNHALRLEPWNPEIHTNLGSTLRSQGKIDEAIEAQQKAVQLHPGFSIAYYNLALALQDRGRLEEAKNSFFKAIELNGSAAVYWYGLHSLLIDPSNMTPALSVLKKAAELEPHNLKYRFDFGLCLDCAGQPDGASACFDMIESKGAPYDRARLDAWRYIKAAGDPLPVLFGSAIEGFRMGFAAARQEGWVLEFGVRHGNSLRQIADLTAGAIHGFDSFAGLPEDWHGEAKETYSTGLQIPDVPDHVTLHAGWFENTIPLFLQNHEGPARLVNIDCDLYGSAKTVLDHLAGRIGPGTVLIFDEYIGNLHWRADEFKAFQEAVSQYGWRYKYLGFSFATKQVVIKIL